MVKKAKKKSRSIQKERRVSSASPTTIPQNLDSSDEIRGSVVVVNERKACTHMSKDVDLGKFSSKIDSLESLRCEDCREVAVDRRSAKGRNKSGKKKGAGSLDAKSDLRAIWVCLECAHFSCGGIGLPTIPQSHAARHSRQHRHPCVIQFDNPQLRWCFLCNSLIPVEKSENNGEQKDTLLDVVKLFKGELSVGTSVDVDVEDVWFGGGNVGNKLVLDNIRSGISDRGYRVRGLANLGNTCFFNSVMQNLFAIDMLRDYFMKLEGYFGSLTTALKKLFSEICLDADSRSVINPKSFFVCLCSKAPQFRGYQQQDSHELLRCLLDGLCTEELEARRFQDSNVEGETSSNHRPTSVDAIFGGQLSSTVCCLECGHSSIVYEPFLDLSLPVPTKKSPPKKPVAVSLPRKPKLPPKKSKKKNHLREGTQKRQPDAGSSGCNDPSSSSKPSIVPVIEQSVASIDDSSWLDFVETSNASDFLVSVSQNQDTSNAQDYGNKQVIKDDVEQSPGPSDDVPRLDYEQPGKIAADCHSVSQDFDKSAVQDFEYGTVIQNGMLQDVSNLLSQGGNSNAEPNLELPSSQSNSCEDELPLLVQSSEVLLLPFKEENSTTEGTLGKEDEASTSLGGCEPDGLDFNGFGDLFNEPEMVPDPNTESSLGDVGFQFQATEITETSFVAGNSSDSCPEEVDDSDAPVSVDSCLSQFTKPELLSDKHAWHCENCSKILQGRRRMEVKGQGGLRRFSSGTSMDGVEVRSGNAPSGCNNDSMDLADHLDNGKLENDTVFTTTDESLPLGKRLDDRNQNCTKFANCEKGEEIHSEFVNHISNSLGCLKISQGDKVLGLLNHTTEWQTPAVDNYNASIPTSDSCILDIVQPQPKVPQPLSRICNAEEKENEDEEVHSENVKVMRNATKRILINRVPPILTIHLKRFSQDSHGRLSKLSGQVSFKEAIDLWPYMDPRCGEERDKCEYHLVGVVVHSGSMRSGHYVAYVRGNRSQVRNEKLSGESSWYCISDTHVHEVSLAEVLQCEAYILFYERT